jgi:tetrathionate reductase subunit B
MNPLPVNRRQALEKLGTALGGAVVFVAAGAGSALATKALAATSGATNETNTSPASSQDQSKPPYDPLAHAWLMAIDAEKCIGCGLCVEACKRENKVIPLPFYFRTWIERYVIKKAPPGSGDSRGETLVDSPNGGQDGFPPSKVPPGEVLRSFYVPKLCNQCRASPCIQACPVGATFDSPEGVVLVDPKYCIGCGFCIQACPYSCRFLNPITRTAEKCTLCYHRITKGLKPACVEVCPTGTRIFGDLKDAVAAVPLERFVQEHKVEVLKPHLGTHPQVLYNGLDKEVR